MIIIGIILSTGHEAGERKRERERDVALVIPLELLSFLREIKGIGRSTVRDANCTNTNHKPLSQMYPLSTKSSTINSCNNNTANTH